MLSLVKKPVPCTLTSFRTSCAIAAIVKSSMDAIVTNRPCFIILLSPFSKVRASVETLGREQSPARQRRNSVPFRAASCLEHDMRAFNVPNGDNRSNSGHPSSQRPLGRFDTRQPHRLLSRFSASRQDFGEWQRSYFRIAPVDSSPALLPPLAAYQSL